MPGYFGFYFSMGTLLFLVQGAELCLVSLIVTNELPTFSGLSVLIVAHIIQSVLYLYTFIIFAQAIISWISPGSYHPVTVLIYQLTEPVLRQIRRWVPPTGRFDWSPLITLIIINLLLILLVSPLLNAGLRLARFSG